MSDNILITKQEKHIFYKSLIDALRTIKYLDVAITPKDSNERHTAFVNTIKKHSLEKELEGYYLRGAFYELSKFDKINTYKNKSYLIKMDRLFYFLKKHIKIMEQHKNTSPFSTVNTTYSNHKNFIKPVINAYKITKEDSSSENNKLKILNGYSEEPLAFAICIQSSNKSEYNFLSNENLRNDLQSLSNRIFSYKLKLSKKDIAKSLQAYLMSVYKNDSIYNQLLKDAKPITNNKMIKHIDYISKNFLYSDVSKPHVKNINSINYIIDYRDVFPIMQPSITKAKEFKINSYQDLLLKFS